MNRALCGSLGDEHLSQASLNRQSLAHAARDRSAVVVMVEEEALGDHDIDLISGRVRRAQQLLRTGAIWIERRLPGGHWLMIVRGRFAARASLAWTHACAMTTRYQPGSVT